MKKTLITCMLLLLVITAFAQASFGTYTMFPNKKLAGSYYKPRLAFGKIYDQYLLVLEFTQETDYANFDGSSVLLVKFEDDSVLKLPISRDVKVDKDYSSKWISIMKCYAHFYRTYSCYNIDDSDVDKIVNDRVQIKKIRVSFVNGDVKDYDIDLKYMPKLTEGLVESFNIVESKQSIRKEKMDDVESGF